MTVVVLPTIYGPALDWQGDGEALAAALPANALHEDDAAYALLQLLTRGTAATRVVIDGTDAALQQELGWRPHYTLATGVQRVWPQIRARRVAAQQAAVTHNAGAHWLVLARRAVPYVENIAGALTRDLPRSLRRTEQGWLQLVCQEQQIFVNRDLLQDVPDLAAPVVYEGQVVAVVAVYGLRFDQWSLYQQNLLSVTTRLIASSLGRARQFADGLEARRYVAGTHLLQAAAFAEVRAGLARRQERQTGFGLVLLRLARGLYPYTQAAARTGAGGARGLAGARASAAGGGRRAGGADGHGRFYHAVPAARGAAAAGL